MLYNEMGKSEGVAERVARLEAMTREMVSPTDVAVIKTMLEVIQRDLISLRADATELKGLARQEAENAFNLAEKAAKNGWEGLVIYGCVRDVDVLIQTHVGVQALASHPMKTDKRGIGDLNVVVTFAGVTFRPGEYVYADNNGVLVSPSPLKMPE